MIKVYPAIIHKEDGYWIEFPDLSGCFTNGETLEETITMAQEALGLYLASLMEHEDEIPAPSDIKKIKCKDGEKAYISTDVELYRRDTRAVKKMISIPAWLAKEAEGNNISLSKITQEALKSKLKIA